MQSINFNGERVYPSKVVCIARNYVEHIKELKNEPPENITLFIKPNSSITNELVLPSFGNCHYEGEIAFVIKDDRFVGVGFGLDLTLRDIQGKLKEKGLPWEKAKAFDKAAVFGDFVEFGGDLSDLSLELYINGELKQKGGYDLMIYKPEQVFEEARKYFTFYDYDLLMTGTPKGVGPFSKGDEFVGRILYKGDVLVENKWIAK